MRMCFSACVDSVNYQLVILALVSTRVSVGSISLGLCCSHPRAVLAQWLVSLVTQFSEPEWEFKSFFLVLPGHFSTTSACSRGSSHRQPLRQTCWFGTGGQIWEAGRSTWRQDWRRICANGAAAQFYWLTRVLLKCSPSVLGKENRYRLNLKKKKKKGSKIDPTQYRSKHGLCRWMLSLIQILSLLSCGVSVMCCGIYRIRTEICWDTRD